MRAEKYFFCNFIEASFRNAVSQHYNNKEDFYDYEDYSYSQFFKKTFSPPQSAETKLKVKKVQTPDVHSKSNPSNAKTINMKHTVTTKSTPSR